MIGMEKQFLGESAALLVFLNDEEVTDILINGIHSVFVEKQGQLHYHPSPFQTTAAIWDLIERLVIPLGRRIDATQPYLDGRLGDGSRFHVILPPIALGGPFLSFRRFRKRASLNLSETAPLGTIDWLQEQLRRKKSLLIAGGTGTGKTTLLSVLLDGVSPAERMILIEDTAEITTLHPHVIRLETRPPTPEGNGEVSARSLVRNALRMRPDRLILGECRSEEAFDLLQAMHTGHPGSLCTIHANSALDALRRFESLVLLCGYSLPLRHVREWIASAVSIVVHLEKEGGVRRISEIIQVEGLEGDVYRISPRYSRQRNLTLKWSALGAS